MTLSGLKIPFSDYFWLVLKIGTDVLLPEAVPPLCRCDEFVHRLPRCQIAMIGLSRKSDPIQHLLEGFPPQHYSTSFHLHDLMKFWQCLHSSIVFGKMFYAKAFCVLKSRLKPFLWIWEID